MHSTADRTDVLWIGSTTPTNDRRPGLNEPLAYSAIYSGEVM